MRSSIAVLGACLGLTACIQSGPVVNEAAWRTQAGEGGTTAQLVGTLVEADGCLYVDTEDQRYLPIFEGEPRWTDDGQLSAGGHFYSTGSAVTLGGGEAIPRSVAATVPDACDASRTWWLVHES